MSRTNRTPRIGARFYLGINLSTAEALGRKVPPVLRSLTNASHHRGTTRSIVAAPL